MHQPFEEKKQEEIKKVRRKKQKAGRGKKGKKGWRERERKILQKGIFKKDYEGGKKEWRKRRRKKRDGEKNKLAEEEYEKRKEK